MSVQTTYKYDTAYGCAGGIVDLAPYAIDSFVNEENDGVLKFGMGVAVGTAAGKQIKLPAANTAKVLGVAINNRTTELAINGTLSVAKKAAVGVMRYGRVYVRVATGVTVAYGDALYCLYTGDNKGCFTNVATNAVKVAGRFLGAVNNGVAQVELFNGENGAEYTLPAASASTLGGVKVGTGLAVTSDGTLSVSSGD